MSTPEAYQTYEVNIKNMLNHIRGAVGRIGLATTLIISGGLGVAETMLDTPAVAAETGGYPDADAPCYPPSVMPDGSCNNYDWRIPTKNSSGNIIGWPEWTSRGYGAKNCTDYVAWKVQSRLGKNASGLGNGKQWDDFAPSKGYTVTASPEPGDAAVWNTGKYGHVAFVESVNKDGTVNISQYNKNSSGEYSTQNSVRADNYVDFNGVGKGLDGTTPANPAPAGLNGVTAISSQVENGAQHVYWASADGTLRETWFRPGVVHTNTIQKFGHAITALSSQYTAGDMIQHVYVGTDEGSVYETWFGPNSNGYHTWMAFDSDTPITALASNPPFDGNQHVYWATQGGRVGETWFHPGTVNSWQAFQSNSPIHGLSAQYTPRDGVQHLYWGNDEGRLHETWFRPGVVNTNLMAQFPEPITSVSSQTSPDGTQHVYSGDKDNRMRETWFNASSHGYNTWEAGVFGDDVSALSSRITPDGTQHVYSGAGDSISETWFYPGTINGWSAARSDSRVTAISSQYTSADGVQHIYWGTEDGKVRETWFRPGVVNTWELPS